MGRFYFHLKDGDNLVPDEEGIELPDVAAAKREALLTARELADGIKAGLTQIPEAVVITDEAGLTVEVLAFEEVLPNPLRRSKST
jgi:hypothetical protein